MLVLVTKASNSYWYKFKNVKTIKDLVEIYPEVIVRPNEFQRWSKSDLKQFWNGFKAEDAPLMKKAEYNVIIYDDYVE